MVADKAGQIMRELSADTIWNTDYCGHESFPEGPWRGCDRAIPHVLEKINARRCTGVKGLLHDSMGEIGLAEYLTSLGSKASDSAGAGHGDVVRVDAKHACPFSTNRTSHAEPCCSLSIHS